MTAVLDKDEADKVVVKFTPRKFPLTISAVAKEFVSHQAAQSSPQFRIDRIVAQQTGVAELERVSIEQQVERLALEKVKQIQEEAYREAYQLGLEEGRENAFNERKQDFEERLSSIDELLVRIGNLKSELVNANEAHLMKLLFFMASRVAMDEIRTRPETILVVLKQAVESAQSDEKVTVRVAKSDMEFIQSVGEKLSREMDFVKKLRMEESDSIQPGGCVVETNFGSVDASIEKRVSKLWDAIAEKLPKVDETIGDE